MRNKRYRMVMLASYPPVVTLVLICLFVMYGHRSLPQVHEAGQIGLRVLGQGFDAAGFVQPQMKKPGTARLLIRCRQLTVVTCIHRVARGGSSNQPATIVSWTL